MITARTFLTRTNLIRGLCTMLVFIGFLGAIGQVGAYTQTYESLCGGSHTYEIFKESSPSCSIRGDHKGLAYQYDIVSYLPCEDTTKEVSVDITVPYWGTIYNGSDIDYQGSGVVLGVYSGQIPGKITSSARDGGLSFLINWSYYTGNCGSFQPVYASVIKEYGRGSACGGGQTCVNGLSCESLAYYNGANVCRTTAATCEEPPTACDLLDDIYLGYNDPLDDYFSCDTNGRIFHVDPLGDEDEFIQTDSLVSKTEGNPTYFGYEATNESITYASIMLEYPVLGDSIYKYIPTDIQIPAVYEGGAVDVPASQVTIYHRNQDGTCDTDTQIYTTGGALNEFTYPGYGSWDIPDDYGKLFYGLCVLVEWDFSGYPGAVLKGAGKGIFFNGNDGLNDSYGAYNPFSIDSTYNPSAPICLCGNGTLDGTEECDDGNTLNDGNGCLGTCVCDTGYTPTGTGGCSLDPGQVVCGSADGKTYYTASPTDPQTYNSGRTYCSDNTTPSLNYFNGVYTWSCPDEVGCTATNFFCDDGEVNGAEACDDGDENDGTNQAGCAAGNMCDACVCSGPCGNGTWSDTEQCDYSVAGTQHCSLACTCLPGYAPNGSGNCVLLTACGDGTIQSPEACDDGNENNTDRCTMFCKWAICGDGFTQNYGTGSFGEGTGGGASCVGVCGTGTNLGSGCNIDKDCPMGGLLPSPAGSCLIFPNDPPGYCSDASHKPCRTNADCGIATCRTQATVCPAETPNNDGCYKLGVPNGICDPGHGETSFTCEADCPQTIPAYSEECDDGNTNSGDGCSKTCTEEIGWICGDGIKVPEAGEECDDGNQIDTDACSNDCKEADCDPETIYASGSVPGWTCPDGYVLKGCPPPPEPGYTCVKMTYAPIQCFEPVCGNGVLELGEFCDASDPEDPNKDICNNLCTRNFCGDGEISSGSTYTELIRNWNPDQATGLRAIIGSGKVITPGIGGFPTSPKTRELGGFIDLIPDIDQDNIAELAVSARGGYQYTPSLNSVSFDDQKNVDALRSYISASDTYYPSILAMTTIRDLDGVGGQGHPEFVYAELGCTGSLTTVLISATNPVYNPATNVRKIDISPYNCSEVKQLTTIGDVDNNGVDDIAFIINKINPAPTSMEVAVVLLQNTASMRMALRTLTDLGIKRGDNTQILGGIAALGDTNSDTVPDLLIAGQAAGTANQLLVRRLLLTQDIQIQASSDVYKSYVNNGLRELFPHYLPDIDADGGRDIAIVHDYKTTDDTEVTLLRLKSGRTVNEVQTFDLGISPDGGNDGIRLQDISYITIASGGNLVLGDKWAFPLGNGTTRGAIYLYPIQAPYAHYATFTGIVETCDEGSYCDNGTPCETNPSSCAGGPTHCLPRYINGCTPTCQGGCGNGVLDPAGVNGIPGDSDDEVCDDGNANNTDACSNQCKRPSCGDGVLTNMYVQWTGINGEWTGYAEHCDRSFTGSSQSQSCPETCMLSGGVNALCNYQFPSAQVYNLTGDAFFITHGNFLCSYGSRLQNTGYTATGWTWACVSPSSGVNSICSLPRRACGDGIVDNWTGNTPNGESLVTNEECDDGNNNDNDGCAHDCKFEPIMVPWSGDQCTMNSYPQVEEGEYLPVWWFGSGSDLIYTGTPPNNDINYISGATVRCLSAIERGNQASGGTMVITGVSVPCATMSQTGASLISGAIQDFVTEAGSRPLVGTYLFDTGSIASRVRASGTPMYGQYQLTVTGIQMDYVAKRRISPVGTATGTVTISGDNQASNYEDCDNGIDDNGNGFIDCADMTICNPSNPYATNCLPGGGGAGEGEICTNGSDDDLDGFIDCADNNCNNLGQCKPEIRPENCASPADEDGDDIPGCSDPNCMGTPYCYGMLGTSEINYTTCTDGYDNDSDGFTDCNDPQCMAVIRQCHPGLTSPMCYDGQNLEPVFTGAARQPLDNDIYTGATPPIILLKDNFDPQCFLPGIDVNGNQIPSAIISTADDCPICGDPEYSTPYTNSPLGPRCQFYSAACSGVSPGSSYLQRDNRGAYRENESPGSCTGVVDDDRDGWIDCADFDCHAEPLCMPSGNPIPVCTYQPGNPHPLCSCILTAGAPECSPVAGGNENCFNVNADGPIDDNDDGFANAADPDCYIFRGTGHQAPTPITDRTPETFTYAPPTGGEAICSAGFSVSKGYFVQEGFAFSEQANTGLDTTQYTSIGGVPFVAEGTAFDDDVNYLASYQGAGKQYLFNEFVNTRESKAVNTYNFGAYSFKKVPAHHIYFYDGTPTSTLVLDKFSRDNILTDLGGVDALDVEKVSYTIVLPSAGQRLTIQGELLGNGMYISQGEIKFEPESCDYTDVVEGLFVAGSGFLTDTIGNDSLTADERCAGGNLQIKGTLLGMNAGSALAPLRRSVLDAWAGDNLLFDNSLIYQAKELFETCYLPALAHKKGYVVNSNTGFTNYYGPLRNSSTDTCDILTLQDETKKEYRLASGHQVMNTFLNNFLTYILGSALTCQPPIGTSDSLCAKKIDFVLPMMDKISNVNSPFVIPDIFTTMSTEGTAHSISLIEAKAQNFTGDTTTLLGRMQAEGRRFPAWWIDPTAGSSNIDLTDPVHRQLMTQIVGRAFGDIKDAMVEFAPVNNSGPVVTANVPGVVTGMSLISQKLGSAFGSNTAYHSNAKVTTPFTLEQCLGCYVSAGSVCDMSKFFNQLYCASDYRWFTANRGEGLTQGSTRTSRLIDGSSVVISSQPKLWTDLPPGAKEFLNTLVVVPR